MTDLIVDCAARVLALGGQQFPCAIGRGRPRAADAKVEGDGATPLGVWRLRALLLRPDRANLAQTPALPWRWIGKQDGWCDDPRDPAYNRPVRLPHPNSAERLWREDGLYDIIVVLGHNDSPPVPGRGSAIFLHCWRAGAPTEGCVAIAPDALRAIAPGLSTTDSILIR